MQETDLRKALKYLYQPRAGEVVEFDVPPMNFDARREDRCIGFAVRSGPDSKEAGVTELPGFRQSAAWLALAAGMAFAVPAVFSMGLRWERSLFLVPYVGIIGTLLLVYFRRHPLSMKQLTGHWPFALVGIAAASVVLLRNIAGQPASAVPSGLQLVMALAWVGLAYGVTDALLLNVFPVLAVQGAGFFEQQPSRSVRLKRGVVALAASLTLTVAYHLGYTEFQGPAMVSALIGNAIITSTYLLTGSPLAAVATHVIMHAAAVLHGMETTLQVPPHYLS